MKRYTSMTGVGKPHKSQWVAAIFFVVACAGFALPVIPAARRTEASPVKGFFTSGSASGLTPRAQEAGGGSIYTRQPVLLAFFGLDITSPETPWPSIPFGTLRMWDDHTPWTLVEGGGRNRYDWRILDGWVERAQAHHVDVLYTFGDPPRWAASQPDHRCGENPRAPFGTCTPPIDLYTTSRCQGPLAGVTTTDCMFKEYITALMDHVCSGKAANKNCKIRNYSCWNEPNQDGFWSGSYADLAKLCSDFVGTVKAQCRSCTTIGPEVAAAADVGTKMNGDSRSASVYFENFLRASAKYSHDPDAAAFHPYAARLWGLSRAPFPETFAGSGCRGGGGGPDCPETLLQKIAGMRRVMDENNMAAKPLWSTEGSWGVNRQLPDSDAQAAYVSRWLILQASNGVARAIWYLYDNGGRPRGTGGLWAPDTGLNRAGLAFGQVARWLTGATFSKPCSGMRNIWSCGISRPGGYQAEIVWDVSRSYEPAQTRSYRPTGSFTEYRDLAGKTHAISGGSAPVGSEPILLENRTH
ncbi:MAG: hypothetical protein ACRD3T_10220 [Terriglobia bacterium]